MKAKANYLLAKKLIENKLSLYQKYDSVTIEYDLKNGSISIVSKTDTFYCSELFTPICEATGLSYFFTITKDNKIRLEIF